LEDIFFMKSNKLLHILLMSGCLVGCSDEEDTSDTGQNSVLQPDASEQDLDAAPVSDAALASDAAPVGDGPFEIAVCDSPEAGEEFHLCSFGGPESGAESCQFVRDGLDLCCCWATETC